jgi:hypothetical protein
MNRNVQACHPMLTQRDPHPRFTSAELLVLVLIGIVIAAMLVPVVRVVFLGKDGVPAMPPTVTGSPASNGTAKGDRRWAVERPRNGDPAPSLIAGDPMGEGVGRGVGQPSTAP